MTQENKVVVSAFDRFSKELNLFLSIIKQHKMYKSDHMYAENELQQSFKRLTEVYNEELGNVINFSCVINKDYLAPYYDYDARRVLADENLRFFTHQGQVDYDLNHFHLTSDQVDTEDNEAWGRFLNKVGIKMLLDPELTEWKKHFPDSIIVFQEQDDEFSPDGETLPSSKARQHMEQVFPQGYKGDDKYYHIGNEGVARPNKF